MDIETVRSLDAVIAKLDDVKDTLYTTKVLNRDDGSKIAIDAEAFHAFLGIAGATGMLRNIRDTGVFAHATSETRPVVSTPTLHDSNTKVTTSMLFTYPPQLRHDEPTPSKIPLPASQPNTPNPSAPNPFPFNIPLPASGPNTPNPSTPSAAAFSIPLPPSGHNTPHPSTPNPTPFNTPLPASQPNTPGSATKTTPKVLSAALTDEIRPPTTFINPSTGAHNWPLALHSANTMPTPNYIPSTPDFGKATPKGTQINFTGTSRPIDTTSHNIQTQLGLTHDYCVEDCKPAEASHVWTDKLTGAKYVVRLCKGKEEGKDKATETQTWGGPVAGLSRGGTILF